MPRVVITHVDEGPVASTLPAGIETPAGEARAVLGGDRPLWLYMQALPAGGTLRWQSPATDHLLYVWSGSITVEDTPVDEGGAVIAEHGSAGALTAGEQGATLLDFQPGEGATALQRAGGNRHAIPPTGVFQRATERGSGSTIYADATCPTCTLWLHKSDFPTASKVDVHYHTEDEILFVTRGEMVVGRRRLGPGSALAIDKETQYGFEAGKDGVSFLTYRPAEAGLVWIKDGQPAGPPRKAGDNIRGSTR